MMFLSARLRRRWREGRRNLHTGQQVECLHERPENPQGNRTPIGNAGVFVDEVGDPWCDMYDMDMYCFIQDVEISEFSTKFTVKLTKGKYATESNRSNFPVRTWAPVNNNKKNKQNMWIYEKIWYKSSKPKWLFLRRRRISVSLLNLTKTVKIEIK